MSNLPDSVKVWFTGLSRDEMIKARAELSALIPPMSFRLRCKPQPELVLLVMTTLKKLAINAEPTRKDDWIIWTFKSKEDRNRAFLCNAFERVSL